MNSDHEHVMALMEGLAVRMATIPSEMRALSRAIRKDKRKDLTRAKRIARALRRTLVCAAGHNLVIASEHVERWIGTYLTFCARLHVVPPAVRVPRSMQYKLGKLIGGSPPPSRSLWDVRPPLACLYQTALAHSSDTILSATSTEKVTPNDRTREAPSGE